MSTVTLDELRSRVDELIEEAYEHAANDLAVDAASYMAGVSVGMWQAYEEIRDILNGQDSQADRSVGHA